MQLTPVKAIKRPLSISYFKMKPRTVKIGKSINGIAGFNFERNKIEPQKVID